MGEKIEKINIKREEADDMEEEDEEKTLVTSTKGNLEFGDNGVKKDVITWPDEDLFELVRRMERSTPDNDNLSYGTRSEKLAWEHIAFNDYTVNDCKKMWSLLQKKVRRYRTLNEVLSDTKDWITVQQRKRQTKLKSSLKTKKTKLKHPDTPFLCFYRDVKDKVKEDNPELAPIDVMKKVNEQYKNLADESKGKYTRMAEESKEEYNKKLQEILETNPNYLEENSTAKKTKDRIPKRPRTPFSYYYSSEIRRMSIPNADRGTFRETCKNKWKELSDKAKLPWIHMTEVELGKYTDEVESYSSNHPEFKNHPIKKLLTKEEIQIKQRLAGKPVRPPQSAYSLFSSEMLQSAEVKQQIPTKQRLTYVSSEWKKKSEEEKQVYKDRVSEKIDKYKIDFANYLKSLPSDQRNSEMLNDTPRRKIYKKEKKVTTKNKVKMIKTETTEDEDAPPKKKFKEPQQPPISAYKYFVTTYKGSETAAQVWKSLSNKEKQKYDDELMQKKRQYIMDFEKFLNSLSKTELEEYSKLRKEAAKQKSEEEEDEDEEEEDEESEESAGSDSESE